MAPTHMATASNAPVHDHLLGSYLCTQQGTAGFEISRITRSQYNFYEGTFFRKMVQLYLNKKTDKTIFMHHEYILFRLRDAGKYIQKNSNFETREVGTNININNLGGRIIESAENCVPLHLHATVVSASAQ